MRARRTFGFLLAAVFLISSTGCLGTQIDAHTRSSQSYTSLNIHLLAAPTVLKADECRQGLSEVSTWVPLWGLAVGILTFGIVVPQWTTYTCAVR